MEEHGELGEQQARYYARPQVYGIEFMHATFLTYGYARHFHDYFALGVIEKGFQTFACGSQKYHTPPSGIFVINPGEPHTGEAATEAGFSYSVFYPQVALLEMVASEMTGRPQSTPFFGIPRLDDPDLAQSLLKLRRTLTEANTALESQQQLLEVFGKLITRHADRKYYLQTVKRERAAVRRAREYIEAHYAENVTLTELAEVVAFSPFYLSQVFKADVGLPPHTYLENVRVRRAQELLSQGYSLAQVAQQTGFSHQSHFTNSFKRYIGVTPGQYVQKRKDLQDLK